MVVRKTTEPLQIAFRSSKNARRSQFTGSKSGETAVTLVFYASSRSGGILVGLTIRSSATTHFYASTGHSKDMLGIKTGGGGGLLP